MAEELPKAPDKQSNDKIKLEGGIHKRDVFIAAMNRAQKRGVAVDVGAHVGTWTINLADRFKKVIAFEPDRVNLSYLCNNIKKANLKNVDIYHAAIGSKEGECKITDGENNSGQSHVTQGKGTPVYALDDVIEEKIDFLKVDAQGFEFFVLMGARRIISDSRPVICLDWSGHAERYGISYQRLEILLKALKMQHVQTVKTNEIWVPI